MIPFPTLIPVRVCSNCENALFGTSGIYCRVDQEDVWRETVAEDCLDFDPVPWTPHVRKEAT